MIALPSLAGIPGALTPPYVDEVAARAALSICAPGPIANPRAGRSAPLEHAALITELRAWIAPQLKRFRFFRPALHLTIGDAPPCACWDSEKHQPISVWLQCVSRDTWDSRWVLEPRWDALERSAPGLPRTVMALAGSLWDIAFPIFTPHHALGMAQWTYWWGELDETLVLEEYHAGNDEGGTVADDSHIIRRAWVDKALPTKVSEIHARPGLGIQKLEALGRRRGPVGEIARKVLLLKHVGKRRFELHREEPDFVRALGYAATLRWNTRDPLPQIYDDHAQHLSETETNVTEAWGWFVLKEPRELRALLDELEQRFAHARLVEDLIEWIAVRSRA